MPSSLIISPLPLWKSCPTTGFLFFGSSVQASISFCVVFLFSVDSVTQFTMELSVPSSSLGLAPALAPRRRCKSSFHHDDKRVPIKTIVKSTIKSLNFPSKSSPKNLQPEVRLYEHGQGGCSKYSSTGQLRRRSIRVCSNVFFSSQFSLACEYNAKFWAWKDGFLAKSYLE